MSNITQNSLNTLNTLNTSRIQTPPKKISRATRHSSLVRQMFHKEGMKDTANEQVTRNAIIPFFNNDPVLPPTDLNQMNMQNSSTNNQDSKVRRQSEETSHDSPEFFAPPSISSNKRFDCSPFNSPNKAVIIQSTKHARFSSPSSSSFSSSSSSFSFSSFSSSSSSFSFSSFSSSSSSSSSSSFSSSSSPGRLSESKQEFTENNNSSFPNTASNNTTPVSTPPRDRSKASSSAAASPNGRGVSLQNFTFDTLNLKINEDDYIREDYANDTEENSAKGNFLSMFKILLEKHLITSEQDLKRHLRDNINITSGKYNFIYTNNPQKIYLAPEKLKENSSEKRSSSATASSSVAHTGIVKLLIRKGFTHSMLALAFAIKEQHTTTIEEVEKQLNEQKEEKETITQFMVTLFQKSEILSAGTVTFTMSEDDTITINSIDDKSGHFEPEGLERLTLPLQKLVPEFNVRLNNPLVVEYYDEDLAKRMNPKLKLKKSEKLEKTTKVTVANTLNLNDFATQQRITLNTRKTHFR